MSASAKSPGAGIKPAIGTPPSIELEATLGRLLEGWVG